MIPLHNLWKNRRQKKRSRSSECNFVALWFNLPTCDGDSSGFVNGQLFPFAGQSCESHFAWQMHTTSLVLYLNVKSPRNMKACASRNLLQAALFTCAFSVSVIGFVKLSLYESCIRSSVPIRYWLFISQTEWKRSFVSNPCVFDSISFGFHHAKVTLGLWSVTRDFWQNCSNV